MSDMLLTLVSVRPLCEPPASSFSHNGSRQEFYVRFKGPEESSYPWVILVGLAANGLQPHSKEASGRCTSSYQTSTPTSRRVSASLIASSTPTSTSCMSAPLLKVESNSTRRSGSVCLDVINQTWSPMFDMINIFEVFLPQLLRYPNPTDPLNGEAAALLMREPKSYEAKVKGE